MWWKRMGIILFVILLTAGILFYKKNVVRTAMRSVDKIGVWKKAAGCKSFNYGGKTYRVVMIGNQCWMAENLNIGSRIDSCKNGSCLGDSCGQTCAARGDSSKNQGTSCIDIQKYCYNDTTDSYCDHEGGLYQWDQTMCGSTVEGAQGICPPGWHIPTDAEWKILEGTIDSAYSVGDLEWNRINWRGDNAGSKLKSGDFAALLVGSRDPSGDFNSHGWGADFWTSTASGSNSWVRVPILPQSQLYRYANDRQNGASVRCLKN